MISGSIPLPSANKYGMNLNFNTVKRINIDLGTQCNLSCPGCSRTREKNAGRLPAYIMPIDTFKSVVNDTNRLDAITFSGQYSDPIFSTNLFECLEYIRTLKKVPKLDFSTNASGRTAEWWAKFAGYLDNGGNRVMFAVDGLSDTNHIYRIGSKWDTIITGARVLRQHFNNTTNVLEWAFCVFEHNHHQVIEAYELSKQLGFDKFSLRRGDRVEGTDLGLKSKTWEEVLSTLEDYMHGSK